MSSENDPPFGSLRRLYVAFFNTFSVGKADTAKDDGQGSSYQKASEGVWKSPQFQESATVTHWRDVVYSDAQRQDGLKLDIPSKILLRKASRVQSGGSAKDLDPFQDLGNTEGRPPRPAQITPPTVELVAFYSEHRQQNRAMSIASRTGSVTFPRLCKGSVAQLSLMSEELRKSAAAEVAVTYADVHIAPGTFATSPTRAEVPIGPEPFSSELKTVFMRSSGERMKQQAVAASRAAPVPLQVLIRRHSS